MQQLLHLMYGLVVRLTDVARRCILTSFAAALKQLTDYHATAGSIASALLEVLGIFAYSLSFL